MSASLPDIKSKQLYLKTILMDLAKPVVLAAQNNAQARQEIYAELAKNIDGDDNALVDIFHQKIPALSADRTFTSTLALFGNLDGDKYFPQVFIPSYSELAAGGQIGRNPQITAVFYAGDESVSTVESYTLAKDGTWQITAQVTENVARSKEIWVFSLNETFTNNIDLSVVPYGTGLGTGKDHVVRPGDSNTEPVQKPTGPTGPILPWPSVPKSSDYYWPYIQDMTIREHKESWLAGKSDIYMKTYTGWNYNMSKNPYDETPKQIMWVNNAYGDVYVQKFKRSWIPNTAYRVNFGYAGSWLPGPYNAAGWEGDAFNYVIFEKDQWPVGDKHAIIDNKGHAGDYSYKSADEYYEKGIILFWGDPGTHMNGYLKEIPAIRFNSRL
jgi:hypothetical protein